MGYVSFREGSKSIDSGPAFFESPKLSDGATRRLDLLGTPSSMWKAKEKVETVLGSTLEQCCEPIYCDLAYVSKTLGMSINMSCMYDR